MEILDKRKNKNIKIIQGDFLDIELNFSFEYIIAIEIINSFTNLEGFFNKVNSLLTLQGQFVFTSVNRISFRTYISKLLVKYDYQYNNKSVNEYKALIYNSGFYIQNIKGFMWQPFKVNSNSKMVPFFKKIENEFKLSKYLNQSPWLMFSVKKIKNI